MLHEAARRHVHEGLPPMKDTLPSKDTTTLNATDGSASAVARPTPAGGLLILGAVVAALAVYEVIDYVLGIADGWVGFVFLLYWGAIEQMKFEKLPNCVVGALLGLALAYGLQALPASMGSVGWALFGCAILASVYCLIMGWWPIAVNNSTMLFLTVSTIPAVQVGTAFPKLFPALGIGVAYFAGLGWIIQVLMQRSAGRQAT
jgi:hypothetical protein